jgi:1-acyl-sn-glycerol-3-phosphate acyltransferase
MTGPARLTVFDTAVVAPMLAWVSRVVLRLRGWTTSVLLPEGGRAVVVLAPHTSYWDFPILMMLAFAHRVSARWMATDALFRRPYGWLFRWLGGIPVDRSRSLGLTASAVATFDEWDRLLLCIAPEGTRYPVERWRTGFYRIAVGAGVPILLAFVDSATRTAAAVESFMPSGDLAVDGELIRSYYRGKVGIRPERTTVPVFD